MPIAKKIFYVWGANELKRPDVHLCIKTWQYAMPDYEIIEINENSTEYFNFQKELKENKWFRTVYERKMYAYVADYVRVKTLYDNGGIYLDTDVTAIKSFDPFLNEPAFVGLQSDDVNSDFVEPAILGAQKGNQLLKQIKEFYDGDIWTLPIYSAPQIFGYFIKRNFKSFEIKPREVQKIMRFDTLTICPERYFVPFRYKERFVPKCIKEDTFALHWFGSSWINPEMIFFLQNKHEIPLDKIDELCPIYLKMTSKNNFLQNIFSIKRTIDQTQKVVTILGLKFYITK